MDSELDQENILPSSQTAPPSSPLAPPSNSRSGRLRKPPSVTPRRFGRFFTPRSNFSSGSAASRQLRDITRNANNRTKEPLNFEDIDERPAKRRKSSIEPDQPKSIEDNFIITPSKNVQAAGEEYGDWGEEYPGWIRQRETRTVLQDTRARLRTNYGFARQHIPRMSSAEHYYTSSSLSHRFVSNDRWSTPVLPYTITSTNHSTLVAAAADDFHIRILDTALGSSHFSTPYLTFKVHDNAVMDMAFSPDDSLIATASGDQTACITDMKTQTPLLRLREHCSSLKQVQWSPGSDHTLATCSRDGMVCIWDIRAPPSQVAQKLKCASSTSPIADSAKNIHPTHSMIPPLPHHTGTSTPSSRSSTPSLSMRSLLPSVTALAFLPTHPKMFLTATDSSAHLHLWDIRMPGRRSRSTRSTAFTTSYSNPLATTELPELHQKRSWGTTSIVVSALSRNIFATCRDSRIYSYPIDRIALGGSRTYEDPAKGARKWQTTNQSMSPQYALYHHDFECNSFYVRATIDPEGETLAVGSSKNCAVLFPTADQPLGGWYGELPHHDAGHTLTGAHTQEVSAIAFARGSERYDEALAKNHNAWMMDDGADVERLKEDECEDIASAYSSALVTTSDDCTARVWRKHRGWAECARGGLAGWGWADEYFAGDDKYEKIS